jgi:hypothetical protein
MESFHAAFTSVNLLYFRLRDSNPCASRSEQLVRFLAGFLVKAEPFSGSDAFNERALGGQRVSGKFRR